MRIVPPEDISWKLPRDINPNSTLRTSLEEAEATRHR